MKGEHALGATFANLQYDVVFSTKNRNPFICDALRPRLSKFRALLKADGIDSDEDYIGL